MWRAVAAIVVGGLLTAIPEPVLSTTLGLTLLMKGVRMLKDGKKGEPPQNG